MKNTKQKSTPIFLTFLFLTMMGGAFAMKDEVFYSPPLDHLADIKAINARLTSLLSSYTPHHSVLAPVTAYSSIDSCHYANCVMASGNPAYIGAVACPRHIPLFTRITINDITYTCEDRTSLLYPDRFDIFMGYGPEAHQRALDFGLQTHTVYYKITP